MPSESVPSYDGFFYKKSRKNKTKQKMNPPYKQKGKT